MSLYYGQPSYGANAFSQPSLPNHYPLVPAPAPAPVMPMYMDPATFRRDFSSRLAELTINSRPLIQNLSMMAHDYSRFADIVAQCIDAHIRKVPPWVKLPVFYLLDMISKNIYEPYARHFARSVISLFIDTYQQVDEPTRNKMVELALTWRTGSPTGKELFGLPAQVQIERSIWGDGSNSSSTNGFYTGVGQITKAQVLSELEFTLGQKERAVQTNPNDFTSKNHVNVLHQLRKIVEAGVSQNDLQQILNQLRTLMRSNAQQSLPPPPPLPPASTQQWASNSYSTPPAPMLIHPPSNPIIPAPANFNAAPSYPLPTFEPVDTSSTQLSFISPTPVPAIATAGPSTQTPDFTSLLSSLVKAGVVTANSTPTGAGATVHDEGAVVMSEAIVKAREDARLYRKSILSHSVQLTAAAITKTRPPINDLLYDQHGAQCKQCGIRFLDTADGKKALESHLDMHFRQNLKANQNIGRGHSRSWFVGAEDWVLDVKGKGRADGSRPINAKAAADAEAAERDAKLRSEFVVVPPGDESKSLSCPICKESLKSEFLEDDEEWVWKNAVKKDDRIFHATCHAEASANVLAVRLRSDVNSRSRSGTPESNTPVMARLSLSPDPVARGIKRKVEDESSSLTDEAENSPHRKKLALSAS
ncbi:hypothetical protein GGU11DRAFT_778359 [Lentinula aff. detonsa]|uniref:CID domain-containing protein n=1 Tax=Lentinula aff. detonsa TaxID=2804958 RepID=A0AA38NQZ2_9AGAR|nr:hypothetical protein GGU10DRAFT_284310 [Lentinula aff. detonsa]KAJ3799085.1 hypothetical protein GGU11DRAFT_778359 [Lentinula aff. detonsa]